MTPRDTLARFWAKVQTAGPVPAHAPELGPCWTWTGGHNRDGYGVFRQGRRVRYAHQVAYEVHRGAAPAGLVRDHLCRNRGCPNPSHLEPVRQGENVRRGASPLGMLGGMGWRTRRELGRQDRHMQTIRSEGDR